MSKKQRYMTERVFHHNGLRCVVLVANGGHRCGYVGVNPVHPLYGLGYSAEIQMSDDDYSKWADQGIDVDKVGPINVLCHALKKEGDSKSPELNLLLECHGGLTYASGGKQSKYPISSDLWWFGFDCAHYMDAPDYQFLKVFSPEQYKVVMKFSLHTDGVIRSLEYCIQECKNLADQLSSF